MSRLRSVILIAAVAAACSASAYRNECDPPTAAQPQFLLSPPQQDEPLKVLFDFELYDVLNIDSVAETFEFSGMMTLAWKDPRLAFDPAVTGAPEKIYQGSYQFDELAAGWFPQVVLLNESGAYIKSGVHLRIQADGTSVLSEKITAVAEATLDMQSFPFDAHRLEAVFALMGQASDEAVLRLRPGAENSSSSIRIPGWSYRGFGLSARAPPGQPAAVMLAIDVQREASYIRRLITLPMLVIVLLSFSIFWMDKASLADRNSISFIGVLTGVAYQHLVVSVTPPTSYVTLMDGFLFISFFTMAATVPVNLAVAALDRSGRWDLGDLVDRRCRWLFPLLYFGLIGLTVTVVLTRA